MKKTNYIYKTFILVSTFIFLNYLSNAQTALNGKISNSKDSSAVKAVSIYIPDLNRFTVSNDSGIYKFENLPQSILNIQFSSIGFKTILKTVDITKTTTLDLQMEPSATELEEALVTSNYSKLTDNTPFPANSVSLNDIRKFSSPSVMGNLSYQPGIDKITIGNGIAKPVIRGLSFNQIMLYAQGTRIENQQWDDHHDLGLSDVGIDNVEIVRGPAALIYGADALGGALIFVDQKPAAAGKILGDVNLGYNSNTAGFDGDIGLRGTSNNGFFYGGRFGGSSQTSYIQGEEEDAGSGEEDKPFAPNSKFMNTVGKANIGISKKWGVSKLSYSYLNQQIGIIEDEGDTAGGNDEEEQRDREMEAPYQDVTTQIISLENTLLLGKSKLNLNVAYQINNRKEYEPTPEKTKELAIGLDLNTTTYDVKWTSNQEKSFGVTIGSQGTFLKNENNGKEALVPNADVSDIAGYGLLRYDHKNLNVLAGIRFDSRKIEAEKYEGGVEEDTLINISEQDTVEEFETDFEKEYAPVSFSLGATYKLGNHFKIKLNGATGFAAPNYAQLGAFGKHEGTYRFEIGDEDLKIEQNIEGDLGLIFESQFITLNVAGYINKVKDYIYIINTGDTMLRITPDGRDYLPIYKYEQGDATLVGGEFGFDIHPKSLKWLDLNMSYSMTQGTLDAGGNLPYIPAGKLIGELKLMANKLGPLHDNYFSIIVSNYSEQENVTEYEMSTEGYTLLDLHLGSSIKLGKQKASFDIFCTNVLNTGYYNQLSLVKYIGVRDMGRNIGVKLSIPFGLK